jgi:CheY-like chemotaxis protein
MVQVVSAASNALRPNAEAKGIAFSVDVKTPVRPILGDAARLQQVVWNLLANALKFTPRGGNVEVNLRGVSGGAELTIRDDGQGIAAETLPHIFDRFKQGESSFTRSHGGLGLGLAIVRHLVDLHGGHVSAESSGAGQGSTFTAFVPCMEGAVVATSPRRSSWPPVMLGSALDGLHVLLVDDDQDGREVTALLLRQQGARVETAASASEALLALDRQRPDIILSDIGMPQQDGLSLLRNVRARGKSSGGSIPAIAISAYARSEDRAQTLQAGFDAYVSKPIEPADLVKAVAKLTGRPARREAGE